jgi:hypothetical protein
MVVSDPNGGGPVVQGFGMFSSRKRFGQALRLRVVTLFIYPSISHLQPLVFWTLVEFIRSASKGRPSVLSSVPTTFAYYFSDALC